MAKADADSRYARKKGRKWVVTLPPELREHLGITHRVPLFWHYPRRGEAVLSLEAERKAGAPLRSDLLRELAEARAQIEAIRRRDESRDRSMYAEGFAHGYIQSYERLATPYGPSADRGHRRAMYRWAHPAAAQLTDPKQSAPRAAPGKPRPNARTRRAKRDGSPAPRAVETVPAPVLEDGASRSGEPAPRRRARATPVLEAMAGEVLAGIAERRVEVPEEQDTEQPSTF